MPVSGVPGVSSVSGIPNESREDRKQVGSIQVVVLESNGFITHDVGDQGQVGVQGPGSNTCLLKFQIRFILSGSRMGCAGCTMSNHRICMECGASGMRGVENAGVGNAWRRIRTSGMRGVGKNVSVWYVASGVKSVRRQERVWRRQERVYRRQEHVWRQAGVASVSGGRGLQVGAGSDMTARPVTVSRRILKEISRWYTLRGSPLCERLVTRLILYTLPWIPIFSTPSPGFSYSPCTCPSLTPFVFVRVKIHTFQDTFPHVAVQLL